MNILKKTLAFGAVAAAFAQPSFGQDGAAYFQGKTIDYIVGTDPGGIYDSNGRLLAEFMQKHLPGSTFVVRNMAGAGGIIAANYIHASPPDGLTMGSFNTGLIYGELIENPALKFKLNDLDWIGKLASDSRVLMFSKDSGIDSFEKLQALETPIKLATCGVGCASMVESTLIVKIFDLPAEVITGYNGNEGQLALRRGEVQGSLGSRSEYAPFAAEGHGTLVVQVGGTETDVPQLASFATTETQKNLSNLIATQSALGRWTALPPGVPADRLEALRTAYAAAVSDPEFIEKAKQMGIPLDPLIGEAVGDLIAGALQQSPEVISLLSETMKAK